MVEHPFIYEINTWVWLDELSARVGKKIGLAGVPAAEWDAIAALGFDAVWLMGVWERSPAGIGIALQNEGLTESFRDALPDVTAEDVVGSPYCIRDYTVDAHLGGAKGLAVGARGARRARPGADPRLRAEPRRARPSVDGRAPRVLRPRQRRGPRARPGVVRPVGERVLANGRDPFFPAWPDVVQLNAFSPDLRARRDRHARRDRRPVRRRALRHGDADDERHLRAHLGRARRRAARHRLLADGDPRDQGAPSRTSSSWPRPTGTSSTRSSSRASTTATTRASTTASSTRAPIRSHAHLTATSATSRSSSASSRTTTSRAPPRPSRRRRTRAAAVTTLTQTGARLVYEGQLEGRRTVQPARLPRAPARRGARRRPARLLRAALRRPRRPRLPRAATGSSANGAAGRGTTPGRTSSSGAGAATARASSSS